jgi:tetratricopeptide (TPR) repeat protein
MNYSLALSGLGQLDRSDEAIVNAARNGYNDPEATLYRRVANYAKRGEKEPRFRAQLVSFLRRIVDAFPENDKYRGSLGKVLFEEKDCEGSEKIFAALSAKGPADLEALNLYALTVWCQRRTDEARALFQKSLALDPSQEIVRRGLADIERGGSAPR